MSLYRKMVHAVVHVFTTDELEDLARLIDAVLMERRHPDEAWEMEDGKTESLARDLEPFSSAKNPPASPRPRYRNPLNPAECWSGRGVKPSWFKALLDQGYSSEDMKTQKTEDLIIQNPSPCAP